MKTSNKILIGFWLFVFLVPVLSLMALKNEIKKGRYVLVRNDYQQAFHEKHAGLLPYKTVRVASAYPGLSCDIRFSDTISYNILKKNNTGDSIYVYNNGDTLMVQYIGPGQLQQEENITGIEYGGMHIQLNIPSAEHLVVDNAEVTIPLMETFGNKNFSAEVNGKGSLNMGMDANSSNAGNQRSITDSQSYRANEVFIKAVDGAVLLYGYADIRRLYIQTTGKTRLTVKDNSGIGETKAHLSDSTIVNANWEFIQKISASAK